MTILVYHFTNLHNWRSIRQQGVLRAGESHVHPRRAMVGGPAVHVTTDSTGHNLGIDAPDWMRDLSDFDEMDKTRIRIAVEVGKKQAPRFVDYCRERNAPPTWVPFLEEKVGGPIGQWRVIRHDVPRESWLHVLDMRSGTPLNMTPVVGQQPVVQGETK